jgi:hypothetical protein
VRPHSHSVRSLCLAVRVLCICFCLVKQLAATCVFESDEREWTVHLCTSFLGKTIACSSRTHTASGAPAQRPLFRFTPDLHQRHPRIIRHLPICLDCYSDARILRSIFGTFRMFPKSVFYRKFTIVFPSSSATFLYAWIVTPMRGSRDLFLSISIFWISVADLGSASACRTRFSPTSGHPASALISTVTNSSLACVSCVSQVRNTHPCTCTLRSCHDSGCPPLPLSFDWLSLFESRFRSLLRYASLLTNSSLACVSCVSQRSYALLFCLRASTVTGYRHSERLSLSDPVKSNHVVEFLGLILVVELLVDRCHYEHPGWDCHRWWWPAAAHELADVAAPASAVDGQQAAW